MEAGRPRETEAVYWQAPKQYKNNGYSLFGLWQSMLVQNRTDEAKELEGRYREAWAYADVELSSSRY